MKFSRFQITRRSISFSSFFTHDVVQHSWHHTAIAKIGIFPETTKKNAKKKQIKMKNMAKIEVFPIFVLRNEWFNWNLIIVMILKYATTTSNFLRQLRQQRTTITLQSDSEVRAVRLKEIRIIEFKSHFVQFISFNRTGDAPTARGRFPRKHENTKTR